MKLASYYSQEIIPIDYRKFHPGEKEAIKPLEKIPTGVGR